MNFSTWKNKSQDSLQSYIKSEETHQKYFRLWSESFQDSNQFFSKWSLANQPSQPKLMAISQKVSNLLSNLNVSLTNHSNSLSSFTNSLQNLNSLQTQINLISKDKSILIEKLNQLNQSKHFNQLQFNQTQEELRGCQTYLNSQLLALNHLKFQIFKDGLLIKLSTLVQLGESIKKNSDQAIRLLEELSEETSIISSSTNVMINKPPSNENHPKKTIPKAHQVSRPISISNSKMVIPEAPQLSRSRSIQTPQIIIPQAPQPCSRSSISSQWQNHHHHHQIPFQMARSQSPSCSSSLILPFDSKRSIDGSLNLNGPSSLGSDPWISSPITQPKLTPIRIELPKADQFRLPSERFNDLLNQSLDHPISSPEEEEEEEIKTDDEDLKRLKLNRSQTEIQRLMNLKSKLMIKFNLKPWNRFKKSVEEDSSMNEFKKIKVNERLNQTDSLKKKKDQSEGQDEFKKDDELHLTLDSIRNHPVLQRQRHSNLIRVCRNEKFRGKKMKGGVGMRRKSQLDSIQEENLEIDGI